ncbi:uncharacterized protein LOC119320237 isoform X3 [Triticum dicoccoides]|uniref:uncharacterized protein LOC119320237 isoform X3 n=1 Tax=Triticum dicoccoides TaxID=85692 RepID=UPI0018918941|nr:uncharacterized protein LOC119320237 isoform X3 [Triticum dicoccoides]
MESQGGSVVGSGQSLVGCQGVFYHVVGLANPIHQFPVRLLLPCSLAPRAVAATHGDERARPREPMGHCSRRRERLPPLPFPSPGSSSAAAAALHWPASFTPPLLSFPPQYPPPAPILRAREAVAVASSREWRAGSGVPVPCRPPSSYHPPPASRPIPVSRRGTGRSWLFKCPLTAASPSRRRRSYRWTAGRRRVASDSHRRSSIRSRGWPPSLEQERLLAVPMVVAATMARMVVAAARTCPRRSRHPSQGPSHPSRPRDLARIGGARTMALQGIEPEECDPSCQDRFLRVGLTKHHQEIAECFNQRGVSLIFLLRRKKTSAAKYQETKWNS